MMKIRLAVNENVMTRCQLEELGISEDSLAGMLEECYSGYCAEVRGEVVGFCMADLSMASLFALFVLPGFEGQGIGKQLLKSAVSDFWNAGFTRATLLTEADTRAFRFYLQKGWRHINFASNGDAELELRR